MSEYRKGFHMLRATSHELAALPAHLAPLLTPAEADALTAAADTYAATGAILEISSTPTATPDDYAETRSAWRTPCACCSSPPPTPTNPPTWPTPTGSTG